MSGYWATEELGLFHLRLTFVIVKRKLQSYIVAGQLSTERAKPEKSGDAKPRVLNFRTAGLPKWMQCISSNLADTVEKGAHLGNGVGVFQLLW